MNDEQLWLRGQDIGKPGGSGHR